jgi:hypothetical protein
MWGYLDLIPRNRDVAHARESQEVGSNRRQVLREGNHAFIEIGMRPTVKRARRWILAHVDHAFQKP